MNEFTENVEIQEDASGLKRLAKWVITAAFILLGPGLSRSTGSAIGFWLFYFFWFVFYMAVIGLLNKKKGVSFDYKGLLKESGVIILAFLLLYNVVNLVLSLSRFLPKSVASSLPALLFIGLILLIAGVGIYFVEKNSKS